MKIAVFHNCLDSIGGSQIVSLYLARHFNADLYTTNISKKKIKKMGFSDVLPRIKSIGKVPNRFPLRQNISSYRFGRLRLGNKYDMYIIAGDWAISGAVNNKPNICYFYGPINELWAYRDRLRQLHPWYKKILYDMWVSANRRLYRRHFLHTERRISISDMTRQRLKRFFDSDSTIINPPIDFTRYNHRPSKNFWLSVNRLSPDKRIDIQLKAFSRIPDKNLIIVGSYEPDVPHYENYRRYIESIKPKNVKILNWVSDDDLIRLYSECQGLIATARDEDFGLTPIEAMASGKPVVACDEGGYKETIKDGETGFLMKDIDDQSLADTIENVEYILKENPGKFKNLCRQEAKKYDVQMFIEKFRDLMKDE